jgi:hypothetical protein
VCVVVCLGAHGMKLCVLLFLCFPPCSVLAWCFGRLNDVYLHAVAVYFG